MKLKTILIFIAIMFNSGHAISSDLKCGESKLFTKFSHFNYSNRAIVAKSIINDMKHSDIDMKGFSEIEMETKLNELIILERKPYKLENQKEYTQLNNRYIIERKKPKAEQDKKAIGIIVKTMKEYKKICFKENMLLGSLQEARRVMWYKYMCDTNSKKYCKSFRINDYY